jgi:hypothetical protein
LFFGKVKGALIGQEIPDEIILLDVVPEILNRISTDELQHIFAGGLKALKM